MASEPDAFRNLATVMAYDSGVEAGRAAERARVVGELQRRFDAAEPCDERDNQYNEGHMHGQCAALADAIEWLQTAAPRGTTRDQG